MDCKLCSRYTVQVTCSTLNTLYSQKTVQCSAPRVFKETVESRKLVENSVKHQVSEHKVKPGSTALQCAMQSEKAQAITAHCTLHTLHNAACAVCSEACDTPYHRTSYSH